MGPNLAFALRSKPEGLREARALSAVAHEEPIPLHSAAHLFDEPLEVVQGDGVLLQLGVEPPPAGDLILLHADIALQNDECPVPVQALAITHEHVDRVPEGALWALVQLHRSGALVHLVLGRVDRVLLDRGTQLLDGDLAQLLLAPLFLETERFGGGLGGCLTLAAHGRDETSQIEDNFANGNEHRSLP